MTERVFLHISLHKAATMKLRQQSSITLIDLLRRVVYLITARAIFRDQGRREPGTSRLPLADGPSRLAIVTMCSAMYFDGVMRQLKCAFCLWQDRLTRLKFLSLGVMLLLTSQTCNATTAATDSLTDVLPSASAHVLVASNALRRLPATFFGFNIEYFVFQQGLFDQGQERVKPEAVRYFKEMPGSVYRYPGGLISNRFNWEWAIGKQEQRLPQRAVVWHDPIPVSFGLDEYFSFLDKVGGIPWYTLNLVGWSSTEMIHELPSETIAASNKRLAQYLRAKIGSKPVIRYYQLGNELDRSEYEWAPEKYIQRARDTIQAISTVDPDARFVAFLRDFNWIYRSRFGRNTYQDFMREVLTELPMVNDYSFQYYYDDPVERRGDVSVIPKRLAMFKKAIQYATDVRGGKSPRVWITEYGRSRLPTLKSAQAYKFTAGIGGAISAADFLIAIAQVPAIQGAFLHIGGQWSLFDDTGKGLEPMPLYWALRVLREVRLPIVLATQSSSPNIGGYKGGYDMRAVAFTDAERSEYGLWVVNRAHRPTRVTVEFPELAGANLDIRHIYMAGHEGIRADIDASPPTVNLTGQLQTNRVDSRGKLTLELPANSVSSFLLSRAAPK